MYGILKASLTLQRRDILSAVATLKAARATF
jgi:hypothetical protein